MCMLILSFHCVCLDQITCLPKFIRLYKDFNIDFIGRILIVWYPLQLKIVKVCEGR